MAGAGGVVLGGEGVAVGVGEPGERDRSLLAVGGPVHDGDALFGEGGGERGLLGRFGAVVADALGGVVEPALGGGVQQDLDGFGVVVELGQHGGLVQGQLVGELAQGRALRGGLGGLDGGLGGGGPLGDLVVAETGEGHLLDGGDALAVAERGPVLVLDVLVDQPVGVGGRLVADDGGQWLSGLAGGEGAALACQNGHGAVLGPVQQHGLEDAALAD